MSPGPTAMELTPREREILQLLWDGLTVKQIAARLELNYRHTLALLQQLLARQGVSTHIGLIRLALTRGWVQV